MKFKLVEKFDETRSMVQEYMYDAMDELNNASLEEYIQWFRSELTYYDDEVERAVTDAYIEACDYGMIKGVDKTRLTSELKDYIDEHDDWFENNLTALYDNCPQHLQHELKILLSKLNESLNEELLTEERYIKVDVSYPVSGDDQEPLYDLNYVYLVVDNKDANVNAINTIFNDAKYKHETVDTYWGNRLKQNAMITNITEVGREKIQEDPDFADHLYIKTNRRLRDATRENMFKELETDNSFKASVGNSLIYVHHPEENELNTSAKDNSYILYEGNNYFPIVIHQLLHMTHVDPRILKDTGKTYIPVVVFDTSKSKYVRRQIQVTLDIC